MLKKISRRRFVKAGALFLPAFSIFTPRLRGQSVYYARPAAGGACATSDTVLAHDEMLFGWETGDAPGGTWTGPTNVNSADAATIDSAYDTSALTSGKPTGACNVGLRTTFTGTSGYDTERFDRGSAIAVGTNVDIRWYIYIQTIFSVRSNILIAGANVDPTGGISFACELRDDGGGTPEIRAGGVTDSAFIATTLNAWHLIHVHIDATNTASSVSVDGGAAQTFTSSAGSGIRYVYVGISTGTAGVTGQWVTDLLAVNTP